MSGAEHFGELHHVTLLRNQSTYTLPVGETRPYFSFDKLARRISEAHVSDSPVVRHTSVANKWKTIHLLLHPGHNATCIQYNVTFQRGDDTEFKMSFNVTVDTREPPQVNVSQAALKDVSKEQKPALTPEPPFFFADVPEDKRGPKVQRRQPVGSQIFVIVPQVNVSLLPAVVQNELQKLEEKLLIGDITMKGYNLTKTELLSPYETMAQFQEKENEAAVQVKLLDAEQLKQDKPPLVPVPIEDTLHTANPLDAGDDRPLPSKLLSRISKIKSTEGVGEPTDGPGAAQVGRRLQQFVPFDRGFLPWEKKKYFQHLLEVNTLSICKG